MGAILERRHGAGDLVVTQERRWDVLGVGDADVDLFLSAPHLPGRDEKVLGRYLGEYPGGVVANFCCAASRMCSRVALATVIGDDRYGKMAIDGLMECGVDTDLVVVKAGGTTYFCVVLIDDSGEKALTVVETDCIAPKRGDLQPQSFGEARLIHLMASDVDVTTWVAREAKRRGTLVSLDIEPTTSSGGLSDLEMLLPYVDFAFPNSGGLRRIVGEDELAGAKEILRMGPTVVVVTMGSRGCLIVTESQVIRLPAFRVQVVDTTGAGDCFNGTFVSGYLKGWDLQRCGQFATAAAAMSIKKVGSRSGLPTVAEVEDFLREGVNGT